MDTKTCKDCKVEFSVDNFYLYKDGRFGSYCKPCNNKRGVIWKRKNPDRVRISTSKYLNGREDNYIRASLRRIFKPSSINPKKFRNYQRVGWKPEITKDELYGELLLHIQLMKEKFPGSDGRLCRYCEKPWTYIRTGKEIKDRSATYTNFSVDRFDTNVTYKIGNVIFCCLRCNALKNASTKEMWIKFLEIDKEINKEKV
jgi:hypothetical protein